MGITVEQVNQDDVIIRQQQMDRRALMSDRRPASFEEYLASNGYRPPRGRSPVRESLAQLAERARRAPYTG